MDYTPYIILIAILVVWIAIVIVVKKKGILSKRGLSTYGPFLMWKTQGGKKLIDRLAKPKRFWLSFATVAKVICLLVGIFIMALLLWEATIVNQIPADKAPSPEMILGIPGINPVIPVVFGIIGLVVGIVVHEFAHGILTRVGNLAVRSLGVILIVVPLGAFVEPEEEDIVKTDRRRRMNIYAAGPAMNIVVAAVCAMLFCVAFMGSVTPVRENPVVVGVGVDSPASVGGLNFASQVTEINGASINSLSDFTSLSASAPGQLVSVNYYYSGQAKTATVANGLTLVSVVSGQAADTAGMKIGMTFVELNNTVVGNQAALSAILNNTRPGQVVPASMLSYDKTTQTYQSLNLTVTLSSRTEYLLQVSPGEVNATTKDIGFLGVNTAYMGLLMNSPDSLIHRLQNPYAGVKDAGGFIGSTLLFIALPFQGLSPIESPLADLFVAGGVLGAMPAGIFWFIANSLYWIFWINLMLGMTNVLPAVPLDGGYLFRDAVDDLVTRFKKNASDQERQKIVAALTYLLAITVFFLIIWQLIGPRLL